MKIVWHTARALSILCIVLAVGWNLKAAAAGDPDAVRLLLSVSQAAGFLVPVWLLWRLAVFSHRKLRSDAG